MKALHERSLGKRAAGILMPVFSLPSSYGIGTLGAEAFDFVDFLAQAGMHYWQVLPMGPTGYGDSPYQTFSTFAGNPYLIDLELLIDDGFLTKKDVARVRFCESEQKIDYYLLYKNRLKVLRKAYEGFLKKATKEQREAFEKFMSSQKAWLADYTLFMTLKEQFKGEAWNKWPLEYKLRKKKALEAARIKYADEIAFRQFVEFVFDTQWTDLRAYATAKNIEIIGDLPIYVAYDSADTWANPSLFDLNPDGSPIEVAGCPPDAFSVTGQLWGNPLYKWDEHKRTGYRWWIKRFKKAFDMFDVLRIDHFRGFESYYAIPAAHQTAEHGKWKKGPANALFKAMEQSIGVKKVIAEDLGFLTPAVKKMLATTGYPGMKILQFAFYPNESQAYEGDYLPHKYEHNCVVYTGTHDNETTRSWFSSLAKSEQVFTAKYVNVKKKSEVVPALIRAGFASVADTCIIPLPDFLNLDNEARINTPSTLGGNWVWRVQKGACTKELAAKIRQLAEVYGRIQESV